MRRQTTYVSLKVGVVRGTLCLQRVPTFLRFVMVGTNWNTLDALDQLDDTPKSEETVLAARYQEGGTVHIDGVRNGRRFGEWRKTALYELVPVQPSQEVLRDTQKWQEWCVAQKSLEQPHVKTQS